MKNAFVKYAFMNLKKFRWYSMIIILGLSIAITSIAIISNYVINEFNVNSFHAKKEQIYRIIREVNFGEIVHNTMIPIGLKNELSKIPEILKIANIYYPAADGSGPVYIKSGENILEEKNFFLSDPELFDIISCSVIMGDIKTFLHDPLSVVITHSAAKKYFGEENPLGKELNILYNKNELALKVSGVIEDYPKNSTLKPGVIGILSEKYTGLQLTGNILETTESFETYVLISKNIEAHKVEEKMRALSYQNTYFEEQKTHKFLLQNISDIYLNTYEKYAFENKTGHNSKITLFSLIIIALFLTGAALTNYSVLSVAIFSSQKKEIGIHKVLGQSDKAFIKQSISEYVLIVLLTVPVVILALVLIKPHIHELFNFNFIWETYLIKQYMLFILFALLIIGGVSILMKWISYSKYKYSNITYASRSTGSRNRMNVFHIIIIMQVVIFVVIVNIGTTIQHQISFAQNKPLGFDKHKLVYLNIRNATDIKNNFAAFTQDLKMNPGIANITSSDYILPSTSIGFMRVQKPDNLTETMVFTVQRTDYNYLQTMKMSLVAGRYFHENEPNKNAIVLNESAVKSLPINNPVNKTIQRFGKKYTIIGIVKDMHIQSVREKIEPLWIYYSHLNAYLTIRLNENEAIAHIKKIWEKYEKNQSFDYYIYDEELRKLYKSEISTVTIINIFSFIIMLIAIMGMLGISQFVARQQQKSVSIKKVFGASLQNIFLSLCKQVVIAVLIANFLAAPISYYYIAHWLNQYASHINITPDIFAYSLLFSVVIVLITVFYNFRKISYSNPIRFLRE